jgi:alpha-2-macroglobulin
MRTFFRSLIVCLTFLNFPEAHADLAKDVQVLVDQQKFQAALDKLKPSLDEKLPPAEYARRLNQTIQLEVALHGYETAVREFRARPWPKAPLPRAASQLLYAATLLSYYQAYSWEIGRREQTVSAEKVDLKAWTADQIFSEMERIYLGLWKDRDFLGRQSRNDIKDVLVANTYPAEVRGTLRDAVTHLYAETLLNRSGWSPREANEIFSLKLADLLDADTAVKVSLESANTHPLQKASAVLADLSKWHQAAGRKDAALDARITVLELLHQSFTATEDKASVLKAFRSTIKSSRSTPWSAWASYRLASLVAESGEPDAKIEARTIANAGLASHPSGPGGANCLAFIASLEAPSYNLEALSPDAPGKRSLTLKYKNISKIYFRSFRVDIKSALLKNQDYGFWLGYRELEKLRTETPYKSWSVDLPATPDLERHTKHLTPPDHEKGFYVIMASLKADFSEQPNQMQGVQMIFSDLVLGRRPEPSDGAVRLDLWDGALGRPVSGASVTVYRMDYNKGHRSVLSEKTDDKGRVRVTGSFLSADQNWQQHFAIAEHKASFAVSSPFTTNRLGAEVPLRQVLIYADRSIYRPGQKVFWKLLAFEGEASVGKLRSSASKSMKIVLRDANGQELLSKTVKTDDFGTAFGDFVIPSGKLLGSWSVAESNGLGQVSVRVEEYKRPTFEVALKDPTTPLRLNHAAAIEGQAKYYFGMPVSEGRVSYRIYRNAILPWWCFSWGFDWGSLTQSQMLGQGQADLQPDGSFKIAFAPKADARLAKGLSELQYEYRIEADVLDSGGETRSAERSFRIGFTDLNASLALGGGYVPAEKEFEAEVSRRDLNGLPKVGSGTWRLARLKEPAKTLSPMEQEPSADFVALMKGRQLNADDLVPSRVSPNYDVRAVLRSWPELGSKVAQGKLENGASGTEKLRLPKLAAGAYRLVYDTKDSFGTPVSSQLDFVVAAAKTSLSLPLFAAFESTTVPVGGKARLLVTSGYAGQRIEVQRYRAGRPVDTRVVEMGKHGVILEYPVLEAERGGWQVAVRLMRDYQPVEWTGSLMVPWSNKELSLELSTFRDTIRPGGKEKWTLRLKGPDGKLIGAAGAQILAYMYDRSLDTFAPHSPASVLALYPNTAYGQNYSLDLGSAPSANWSSSFPSRGFSSFSNDHINFYANYGVGGPGARGGYGGMRMKGALGGAPQRFEEAEGAVQDSVGGMMPMSAPMEAQESKLSKAETTPSAKKNDQGSGSAGTAPAIETRSNFNETAFWLPSLTTNAKGEAQVEFEVPDSLTAWSFWTVAVTRDLMSAMTRKDVKTVKELMIRPYLPRFLREGDEMLLKVLVNNSGKAPLKGDLEFQIKDALTQKVLNQDFGLAPAASKKAFSVKPEASESLSFLVKVPAGIRELEVTVTGRSGSFSDGEKRSLFVLPSRMHLAQSKFQILKDKSLKSFDFKDAHEVDASRINEKVVVTLDGQLFYSVLSALPYLVNYPYECTEQVLNRFLSTGIVSSLFEQFPSVKKMAEKMSSRKTQLESFDAPDANRKLALEETPWLEASQGGAKQEALTNVLDSRSARRERERSLSQLEKHQTSLGGFPWFPGGAPSPYMTLYVLHGFSKALEFGVSVPQEIISKAWGYMHQHYIDEIVAKCMAHDSCWEEISFLNYVLSNYPNAKWGNDVFSSAERARMLDFSFKHWKQHSPYLKGYLALTLSRAKRAADAKLVWDSVLDSAKISDEEGTHWAREDRSWLWYQDEIETHAFALRTSMELGSSPKVMDGLVLWLFLNKKLNHWKSTRATSEVLYSLAHYLKKAGQLGVREEAVVKIASEKHNFEFLPDEYTGKKNQVVVPGDKVSEKTFPITVEKSTPGYLFASTTWHYSTEKMPTEDRGDFLKVSRKYFKRMAKGEQIVLIPLSDKELLSLGDEVEVQISVSSKHAAEYVQLRDPRASGFEPISSVSQYKWDFGIGWYEEVRDSATNFFFDWIPQGQFTFKYRMRVTNTGRFRIGPATLQPVYAPEFAAFSRGEVLSVK